MSKVLVQDHNLKINNMLNFVKHEINNSSVYCFKQIVDCEGVKNNIKKIRKKLELTQSGLAELAGCSTQQIEMLENGKRGLDTKWLDAISSAFNKKIGYLGYKPWHLIADLQDVENVIQSEEEQKLLETRRSLKDQEQKTFDAMTATILETIKAMKK